GIDGTAGCADVCPAASGPDGCGVAASAAGPALPMSTPSIAMVVALTRTRAAALRTGPDMRALRWMTTGIISLPAARMARPLPAHPGPSRPLPDSARLAHHPP